MARPLRIQQPGLTYHIYARGNDRVPIFLDDTDRRSFLWLFAEVIARFKIECHAICQMTNHYHAVATTKEANLSRAMQTLNGEYACSFNARHRRKGHLFEDRFGAQIIQLGSYFLTSCRYIVRNPVRAGMVAQPDEWPWSSYRATAGLEEKPEYLSIDRLLREFDDDLEVARVCYLRYVTSARPDVLPRGPVLGDRAFASQFTAAAAGASREVTRGERNVEKRSVKELLAGILTRTDRDAAIVRAYREGFPLCDVARALGVHYTTISKVLRRCQSVKKVIIQDLTPRSAADGEEVVVGAEEESAGGDGGGGNDALADVVARHDLGLRAGLHHHGDATLAREIHVAGAGDG